MLPGCMYVCIVARFRGLGVLDRSTGYNRISLASRRHHLQGHWLTFQRAAPLVQCDDATDASADGNFRLMA